MWNLYIICTWADCMTMIIYETGFYAHVRNILSDYYAFSINLPYYDEWTGQIFQTYYFTLIHSSTVRKAMTTKLIWIDLPPLLYYHQVLWEFNYLWNNFEISTDWRKSAIGMETLQDEDSSTEKVDGWKRLNTLQHCRVHDGANMVLLKRHHTLKSPNGETFY